MANLVYNYFKKALLQGSINTDLATDLYMALVGSGYTPNNDTDVYLSNITNEINGSNYTAGGFALSSPLVTTNNTTNQGVLDGSDILLANVTFNTSPSAGVLYKSTGLGTASDPLIAYVDFGSDQAVTAGTFQIQWAAGGILGLT